MTAASERPVAAVPGSADHTSVVPQRAPMGDAGFVAVEWAVGVAVLVLPMLMLVAALPSWAARHEGAAAAAREGARAVVQVGDWATAIDVGVAAAQSVLADRGIEGGHVVVALPTRRTDGALPREGVVEVTVTLPGLTVELPGFGAVTGPTVSGAHARALDGYRSR